MSETFKVEVSQGQLNLIAKRYGVNAGCSLLDIGCGDGEWVLKLRGRGATVQGVEERHLTTAAPSDAIAIGSPAANLPGGVQSFDRVLFRGTSLIGAEAFHPELMIALANMGSMLKPHGRLVIPVNSANEQEIARWQSMLSSFPGTVRTRTLTGGIAAYLTLSFLFGGNAKITVVDLNIQNKQISKLEWHKLAREAVLKQMTKAQEAA